MSEGLKGGTPDLRGLQDRYEIVGELRGSPAGRTYIGKPHDGSAEVAITVVHRPKGADAGGGGNELSHYAADAQILESVTHPSLARVLDGRWIGNDAYAIVTELIQGETLAERLDRGERFGNPGIALLLQEVSRVLDWARDHGIVHRLVTPDTVFFERDTNRLRMSFAPGAIPITGVPDACGDMRTLGMLAWAMLTGERYDPMSATSVGDVSPNLAARVVDATDRAIRCKDGEAADGAAVATFLGIIASGDVLKQAEVEIAALKEEYDEEHQRELQKCESRRQQVEDHAAEQAAILAGEREEFAKHMADERAALAAERAELERAMTERKDRLTAVRRELDEQRAEMERRLTELEAYRIEVEKARDAATAAAEKARQDAIEAAEKWRKEALAASAAAAAAATAAAEAAAKDAAASAQAAAAASTPDAAAGTPAAGPAPVSGLIQFMGSRTRPTTPSKPMAPVIPPPPPRVSVPKAAMPTPPKALKEMKAPKWDKQMERLDVTDEELIAATAGRPRWMVPAGVAVIAIILVAFIYGITHRTPAPGAAVRVGNTTVAPTLNSAAGNIPRGGFLTQPSGATAGSPATPVATSPIVASSGGQSVDSAAGAVIPILGAPEPDSAAPPAPKPAATHSTPAPSANDSRASTRASSAAASAGSSTASSTNPDASNRASSPSATSNSAAPDTARRADTTSSGSIFSSAAARFDSAARSARARLDSMAAKLMPRRDTTPHPAVTPPPDTGARVTPPAGPPVRPDTMTTAR